MTEINAPADLRQARLNALFELGEWQKLLIHFDLAPDIFAFIPVIVPDSSWADLCREALADFLKTTEKKQLLVIQLTTPGELKNLASTFFDLKPGKKTGALWISAPIPFRSEELEEWQAAWREGMARLNQYRNPFREKFDVPVLLVGAEWIKEIIRNMAPDLWSVQTTMVRIEPPAVSVGETQRIEAPTASGQFESWRGVDPDFALREAERLRGKKGQELALARLLHRASAGFGMRAKYRESLRYSTEAADIIRRHSSEPQGNENIEAQSFLADILNTTGIALRNLGRLNEAITEYDKVIQIRKPLVESGRVESANDLAMAYLNKGVALDSLGKSNEAITEFDKAIQIRKPLVESERAELANELAAAYLNKGVALYNLGRLNEAIAEYDKAIEIYQPLVEGGRIELANDLATAYMNKGVALRNLGRLSEAIDEYDKAIEIYQPLVESGRAELANELAMAYMNKGVALDNLRRLSEAIAEYDKAIQIRKPLVEGGRIELAKELAATYMNKGNALDSLGKSNEAITEYDKAIEIYQPLVESGRVELADYLAKAYMNKGVALKNLGRLSEAVDIYGEAIKLWENAGEVHLLPNLVKAFRNRVEVLIRLEDWEGTAIDVVKAFTPGFQAFQSDEVSEHFKQLIGGEIGEILYLLSEVPGERREEIYRSAGEFGEAIRKLVEDFVENRKKS